MPLKREYSTFELMTSSLVIMSHRTTEQPEKEKQTRREREREECLCGVEDLRWKISWKFLRYQMLCMMWPNSWKKVTTSPCRRSDGRSAVAFEKLATLEWQDVKSCEEEQQRREGKGSGRSEVQAQAKADNEKKKERRESEEKKITEMQKRRSRRYKERRRGAKRRTPISES